MLDATLKGTIIIAYKLQNLWPTWPTGRPLLAMGRIDRRIVGQFVAERLAKQFAGKFQFAEKQTIFSVWKY